MIDTIVTVCQESSEKEPHHYISSSDISQWKVEVLNYIYLQSIILTDTSALFTNDEFEG